MTDTTGFVVLYADASMVVVNKPPNVAMDTPKDATPTESVTVESWACAFMRARGLFSEDHAALQQAGQRRKQLKFVHQLDFSTSGVLCLAFTKPRAAALAHAFEMRQCVKWYVAVLHGHVSKAETSHVAAQWVEPRGRGDVVDSHGSAATKRTVSGVFLCQDWRTEWEPAFVHLKKAFDAEETAARNEGEGARPSPQLRCFSGEECSPDGGDGEHATHDLPTARTSFLAVARRVLTSGEAYEVVLPIGKDTSDPTGFRMGVPGLSTSPVSGGQADNCSQNHPIEDARYASTCVHLLSEGYAPHPVTGAPVPVTRVLLRPLAGRRHQLRVHCAKGLGCPILGDVAYSPDESVGGCEANASCWPRMHLHAWRLAFPADLTRDAALCEATRVAGKKKRRREVKGLVDEPDEGAEAACWTVFQTIDPFATIGAES